MKVERQFTAITYQRTLFRKERIKNFSFFLEICYIPRKRGRMKSHYHGKEVEWEVSFYYWKTFLTMSNKLLYFFVYELIYMLFGSNNFVWKLQLRYIGLLAELSVSSSNVYCCCFYSFDSFYKHCFSVGFFFFFVDQGESLSATGINGQCFMGNKIRKYIQNSLV